MDRGGLFLEGLLLVFVAVSVAFLALWTLKSNDWMVCQSQDAVHRTGTAQCNLERLLIQQRYNGTATFPGFTATNPFDTWIDRIYFINMDHRKDRLQELLGEVDRLGIPRSKVQRIPGVKDRFGALGCSKAHLNALLDCQNHGYRNCIVLEDDFVFKGNRELTWEQLNRLFALHVRWDVVMLASNTFQWERTSLDFLVRILDAQTTGGYMVNGSFLDTLIANFRAGIARLEATTPNKIDCPACIDQYWKALQPTSHWFAFYPVMGHQRDGLSDIEGRVTEYADKNELFERVTQYEYLVCVQNCQARYGKNPDRVKDLQTLSSRHPICYYQYLGNPDLATDFEVNEVDRVITLRCRDDYLNLCHKFGQLLHALRNIILLNKSLHALKGVFFTDDDVVLTVPRFYGFLEGHASHDYWGHVVQAPATSKYLAQKCAESPLIRQQVEAYPELIQHAVEMPLTPYCAGGGFFLRLPLVLSLSDTDDLFAPFPRDADALEAFKVVLADGQTVFSRRLCLMEDVNVGAAVARLRIQPVAVPVREIAAW